MSIAKFHMDNDFPNHLRIIIIFFTVYVRLKNKFLYKNTGRFPINQIIQIITNKRESKTFVRRLQNRYAPQPEPYSKSKSSNVTTVLIVTESIERL